jgi:uncharacterized protein (DUF1800 family)
MRRASAAALVAIVLAVAPAAARAADDERAVRHLLSRATYGARPADVARVRQMGAAAWLERQLDPARLDDTVADAALRDLPTLHLSIAELLRDYPRPDPKARDQVKNGEKHLTVMDGQGALSRREMAERYPLDKRPPRIVAELQAARAVRAVASKRQLYEVMVDFWFNHFNVFAPKGSVPWYVTDYERTVIRRHALGTFPDLVRASARHPAMLFYLDNWLSARDGFVIPMGPNAGRMGGLNENYARELMELHTLGVDGGYTQQDVREVARAFTGWSIERPQQLGHFVFRARMHDDGAKVVLGTRIAPWGGQHDGERVIELLVRHPSTARFIATKLVRRFVSDTPPPALVDRVAGVYRDTGGDIKSMLRAIFSSPEFAAPEHDRVKIKKPMEFVASAVRALDGTLDARGGLTLARASAEIGETLYGAPPPTGWPDRAESWVSAGTLLSRMNFAVALASGRVSGVRADVAALTAGAAGREPRVVLDHLLRALLHDRASDDTRRVLTAQLTEPQITRLSPDDRGPARTDVEKLAALVLGSPEFQRR